MILAVTFPPPELPRSCFDPLPALPTTSLLFSLGGGCSSVLKPLSSPRPSLHAICPLFRALLPLCLLQGAIAFELESSERFIRLS